MTVGMTVGAARPLNPLRCLGIPLLSSAAQSPTAISGGSDMSSIET